MKQLLPSLWDDFVAGNEDAFEDIYKLSYPELYEYGINMGLADFELRDCIQDVFLKLYTKPQMVKTTDSIKSFLFRTLKNRLYNVYRKNYFFSELREELTPFNFDYSIKDELIEAEERQEVKDKIDKMLSLLSVRQKEIIYLRFFKDMEFDEIASIMDLSEQAARNLMSRSFQKLRDTDNLETFKLLLLLLYLSRMLSAAYRAC